MSTKSKNNSDLLRFSVIGNVDDGKSTLIGRLMNDTHSLSEDQIEAIAESSKQRGQDFNFAFVTDGLALEREKGITIDVAYRYFSTPQRRFIIADCPGHFEFTRNMVTGSSSAEAALILVDAEKGLVEQTKRHAFITSYIGINHLIVCVNKMDAVNYSENVFNNIVKSLNEFLTDLKIKEVIFIPISALTGANVVHPMEQLNWYHGGSLLTTLEQILIEDEIPSARFPIQSVITGKFKGYAGKMESGIFEIGENVLILPSGKTGKIRSIHLGDKLIEKCESPMSVLLRLEEEENLSRGDMIVSPKDAPIKVSEIDLFICWFEHKTLSPPFRVILKHTTREVGATLTRIVHKLDVKSMQIHTHEDKLQMNDFALCRFVLDGPLFVDSYNGHHATGSMILIDQNDGGTIGAGIIGIDQLKGKGSKD